LNRKTGGTYTIRQALKG